MRLLIQPTALAELRGLRSRAKRRALVAQLSELGVADPQQAFAGGGRCRLRWRGLTVLYSRRGNDLTISAIEPQAAPGSDPLDSGHRNRTPQSSLSEEK